MLWLKLADVSGVFTISIISAIKQKTTTFRLVAVRTLKLTQYTSMGEVLFSTCAESK
jgi:hypothetical protein